MWRIGGAKNAVSKEKEKELAARPVRQGRPTTKARLFEGDRVCTQEDKATSDDAKRMQKAHNGRLAGSGGELPVSRDDSAEERLHREQM